MGEMNASVAVLARYRDDGRPRGPPRNHTPRPYYARYAGNGLVIVGTGEGSGVGPLRASVLLSLQKCGQSLLVLLQQRGPIPHSLLPIMRPTPSPHALYREQVLLAV